VGDLQRMLLVFLLAAPACATSDQQAWLPERLDPGAFHQSLGRSLYEHGNFERANTELVESLRHEPNNALTHLALGQVYVKRGLVEDAEESFKKAISFNEELIDAYAALGVLYDRSGRSTLADAMHREAIRRDENRADLRNNRGFSLFLRERFREAVVEFRAALRLGAGKRTHNNLGLTYGRLGELENAAREFAQGGTRAEAKNNMGWVYESRGDSLRAASAYREAVKLDPKLSRAKNNLERLARLDDSEDLKP
jgi:Tfp pilus assembly protein PilF